MTDRPTITPMMDMITFSMVVVILHTLMATVVPVVELVEDLVGLVMRDAKTTTQSATLMKIPVLITMMPIHQNVEITIPILSSPLTFAALAMEVAPEAILEATAMEIVLVTVPVLATELNMVTELATVVPVEDLVGQVMRDARTTTQSATLMKIPVLITTMPTQQNVEITIPTLSLQLTFAALAMEVALTVSLVVTQVHMVWATVTELATELDTVTELVAQALVVPQALVVAQALELSYMMVAPMTIL